jgi:hypothetical protein
LAVASASVVGSSAVVGSPAGGDSWVVADLQVVVASAVDFVVTGFTAATDSTEPQAEASTVVAAASMAEAAASTVVAVAVSMAEAVVTVADTGNLCRLIQ